MEEELKKIVSKVRGASEALEKKSEELIQVVIFELDQEEYAVPITDASEIIKIPDVTPIPGAPEFINGILNLRGKIAVVIDLEKRFHLVRERPVGAKHIIITEVGGNTFGVMVDRVTEVLRVPVSAIQPTPALVSSKIHADYLKGVVVLEGQNATKETNGSRLLILLDLPKLLQEKELLEVGEAIQAAVNKKS